MTVSPSSWQAALKKKLILLLPIKLGTILGGAYCLRLSYSRELKTKEQSQARDLGDTLPQCLGGVSHKKDSCGEGEDWTWTAEKCKQQRAWAMEDAVGSGPTLYGRSKPLHL